MAKFPVNSNRQVIRSETTSKGCYRLEKIKCGAKKCKCTRGELHGPYWYLYLYKEGTLRSKYIGKNLDYVIHSKKEVAGIKNESELQQILDQIQNSKVPGEK